jgi:hypothetical protein
MPGDPMVEKTLLDEFAMSALRGLIALDVRPWPKDEHGHPRAATEGEVAEFVAKTSYDYAEAMLKEKAKRHAND